MRCTSPRKVGFLSDGKTLSFSPKNYSKEYPVIQIPCGKCLSCRLEHSRQIALRAYHESQMYKKNCFVTLTYDDDHLESEKLIPAHLEKFIKDLRTKLFSNLLGKLFPDLSQKQQRSLWRSLPDIRRKELYNEIQISSLAVGEYGDKNKRPHWHLLIFNWTPSEPVYKYTTDLGDQVYTSSDLTTLWQRGNSEFGSVTLESAGYVARYSTKKLAHGKDGTHNYDPVVRYSQKNAIGKKWLERYYSDVFSHGYLVLPNGAKSSIPRYYEKWFKKEHPEKWRHYVTEVKPKIMLEAEQKEEKISLEEKKINEKRSGLKGLQIKREKVKKIILEKKFKRLQEFLKL